MRRENSGLIDLDALLKEASQPELPKSADSSLEVSAPPPEPPPPAPVAEPLLSPPHPSSSSSVTSSDDSLQAITTIATVAEVPEPPAKPPADPRPADPPPPSRKRPSFIPWIAIAAVVGVVAIAVGWRHPKESVSHDVASAAQPTVAPIATAPSTAGTTITTGLSLADLPAVATAAVTTSAAPIATQALRAPTAPVASASAKLGEVAETPSSANGDLGGAMRDAVGAKASAEIANVEAPSGEGARQLRPSPGAVVGAINSVMPAARMCLDGSEVVRNATIVFKSDGTVARVDIAGAPNVADDCIRGALTNARTTPFLADTFAARATVRP